ncbi:hypothetical protein B296_00015876 [Ensete ventricosum]|uniref:Uncharacterized protein n=1 Tax=Ensete ventricosum TaxID=4639 RepID=A0A427AJ05_ENSVE|nr:hypothetical protein B296_00015876 [Ensete ventricosum]
MPPCCYSSYYKKNGVQRRLCWWEIETQDPNNGAVRAAILIAWPAMVATTAIKGITRDCNNAASCRGGDSGWAIHASEEEDGSRTKSKGSWCGRQQRCGWHQNNRERIVAGGSCGCGRGLEMAAPGNERRGVRASDDADDVAWELDASVSIAVAGGKWGGSNSDRGGADGKGGATTLLCAAGSVANL